MPTQLLQRFRSVFEGREYRHRRSNTGDKVAQYLYEDLYSLLSSSKGASKYVERVSSGEVVLFSENRTQGVSHRRGDGSLGTRIPREEPIWDDGFEVARARIANLQIGTEVKVISKAMMRQAGRVVTDLQGQRREFRKSNPRVISVAVVGVNHAEEYRSLDGERHYDTTGRGRHKHPIQEAADAIAKVREVEDEYDELLILRYRATNRDPFPFEWVDPEEVERNYESAVVRIADEYENRF